MLGANKAVTTVYPYESKLFHPSLLTLLSPEPTAARWRDIQILLRKSGVRAIFASFQTRIFIEINTKSVLLILSNPYFCDVFSSVCQPIILNQIIYYMNLKYADTNTRAFILLDA
jgi:hypothetical protein